MKIGDYFVTPLHEGHILRDGGVSFGALPKSEWSKLMVPDADNQLRFSLAYFLVQGHGKNILIDAGIGEKLSAVDEKALGVTRLATTDDLLGHHGLKRDDIDMIIMTHLHFASAGGLTSMSKEGVLVPSFPRAAVLVQDGEWERAVHANVRTRPLYRKENFEPLLWHQKLSLIEGDTQVLPGLVTRVTGGHTKMHQIVAIESQGEGAIFWGDLIPTVKHIELNAITALDLYPLGSLEMKARWLTHAIENHWVSFFSRDPQIAAAQLSGSVRGDDGVSYDALLVLG